MAKLNVVVPAVNVTVEGVEYRKVDRAVQAGDIVKALVDGIDILAGNFYKVYSSNGDPAFEDDVNDERISPLEDSPEEFEVYEKVAEVPVETKRRLTVGDYAKVVRNTVSHNYNIGSVVKIVKDDRDHQPYKGEHADGTVGNWMKETDVEPATEAEFLAQKQPTSDEIVHEGRHYRKVDRKANVGDMIVVTGQKGHAHYEIGTVFLVKNVQGEDSTKGRKFGVDKMYIAWECDLTVLEPIAATLQYSEVKRHARVGERIRIVSYNSSTHRTPDSLIKIGDEFTVRDVDSAGDIWYVIEREIRGILYYGRGEYVVLETEPAKPERLNVGDYAKVVDDSDIFPFNNGTVVEVIKTDSSNVPYYVRASDNRTHWAKAHRLARATDEEVATAKLELETKRAAETAAAKWSAIGRKVNEYKEGDIVEATRCLGGKERIIGVVEDVPNNDSNLGLRTADEGYRAVLVEGAKLIVPVEQRFDR